MNRIDNFLKNECGLDDFEIVPLKQDASSRRYYRVKAKDSSYVLMDGNPVRNRFHEFFELSKLLRGNGVYAPEVIRGNLNEGLALLEDFGDDTFTRLLAQGASEEKLYDLATKALASVVKIDEKPDYAAELSVDKVTEDICLFADWYYPLAVGQVLEKSKRDEFAGIVKKLMPMGFNVPNRLLLWDYHIDNLMLLKDGKTCGVLDFQDAFWGPVTYDIMSLVEDARREVSPAVQKKMKDLFFAGLDGVSREDFENSFSFFSMFRHMRVLGRFTILMAKYGKDAYLKHVPHLWNMLERTLENPRFVEMKSWVDNNFPKEKRIAPKNRNIGTAMILAAGRGSRMKELGDEMPKPLIKVKGRSMLDYKLDYIRDINIKNVVVNVCYQGEKIKEFLKKTDDLNVMISEEEEALETGGGLKKARHLFGGKAVVALNSDTLWREEKFKSAMWDLVFEWDEDKYDILLLMNHLDKVKELSRSYGDYFIKDGKPFRNVEKIDGDGYRFAGVYIFNPKIFDGVEEEKFSMLKLFDIAEKKGRLGYVINENMWYHVGTPEDLAVAESSF